MFDAQVRIQRYCGQGAVFERQTMLLVLWQWQWGSHWFLYLTSRIDSHHDILVTPSPQQVIITKHADFFKLMYASPVHHSSEALVLPLTGAWPIDGRSKASLTYIHRLTVWHCMHHHMHVVCWQVIELYTRSKTESQATYGSKIVVTNVQEPRTPAAMYLLTQK